MVLLPVTPEKQNFTVQLGVSRLDFSIYFNERSERWMFDMRDAVTGQAMLMGAPFVLGQDLLEPYIFGIGTIICVDSTQQHEDAGADDLGTRVLVPYYTEKEVATIVNG